MKTTLERTAILSKDLTEQPDDNYVLLFPDLNIVLSVASIYVGEFGIQALDNKDRIIAQFNSTIPWISLKRERVALVTREEQLKRLADNQLAEAKLVKEITKMVDRTVAEETPELHTGRYA